MYLCPVDCERVLFADQSWCTVSRPPIPYWMNGLGGAVWLDSGVCACMDGCPQEPCLTGNRCVPSIARGKHYWRTSVGCHNTVRPALPPPIYQTRGLSHQLPSLTLGSASGRGGLRLALPPAVTVHWTWVMLLGRSTLRAVTKTNTHAQAPRGTRSTQVGCRWVTGVGRWPLVRMTLPSEWCMLSS